MKKKLVQTVILALGLLVLFLPGNQSLQVLQGKLPTRNHLVYAEEASGILTPTGEKHIQLEDKDSLGRARSAHIQLQDKDEPEKKRAPKINYNPVGWHNYKFYYGDGKSKAWLMNRGHLIGYQFSGLNDEGRNLVPMTAWLNTGNYKGTDESNQSGMLYYENRLDNWLANHPNYWLDYKVTAIYQGDELLPRQIQLQYVGVDSSSNLLEIKLGSAKETVDGYGVTRVTLDNVSANAEINYKDGTAKNTVAKASSESSSSPTEASSSTATASSSEMPESTPPSSEAAPAQPAQPAQEESRTVYVARQGTADVYWYDINNMPANTNFGNVVTMTESEAIAQGKRHTLKE